MKFEELLNKISKREDIKNEPPVLLDIGASSNINPMWEKIAKFSICIAFDADDREFNYIEQNDSDFKKLFVINKIVVDKLKENENKKKFYLTESPYCSSLLKPDNEALKVFSYANQFNISEEIELEVIELNEALKKVGVEKIDWFKTDSQGTDLRLYKSLSEDIQNKMIALEFEPGFIDAYLEEDKIPQVLSYMENNKNYFLSDFDVKGSIRIPAEDLNSIFSSEDMQFTANFALKQIPGWAEMTYMNNLVLEDFKSRDFILAWLFASLQERHELAFVYANQGKKKFSENIFSDLKNYSERQIKLVVHNTRNISKFANIYSKIKSKSKGAIRLFTRKTTK